MLGFLFGYWHWMVLVCFPLFRQIFIGFYLFQTQNCLSFRLSSFLFLFSAIFDFYSSLFVPAVILRSLFLQFTFYIKYTKYKWDNIEVNKSFLFLLRYYHCIFLETTWNNTHPLLSNLPKPSQFPTYYRIFFYPPFYSTLKQKFQMEEVSWGLCLPVPREVN